MTGGLLRVYIGRRVLFVRRGNPRWNSEPGWMPPVMVDGPFGCWSATWSWGEISWELARWQ